MSPIALGFLVSSVLLFVFGVFFSYLSYKRRYVSAYHARNHYPFEFNYEVPFKKNIFGNILFCVSTLLMISFYASFDTQHTNGFLIFMTIGGVLGSLVTIALFFTPLKLLKVHLLLTVLSISFGFLVPCAGGIYLAMLYYDSYKIMQLIICILLLFVCLIIFGLILNPKLSSWARTAPSKDENGNVVFLRPKFLILALTEWILIYLSYITGILILLLTIAK